MNNFKSFKTSSCVAIIAGLAVVGWGAPSSAAQTKANTSAAARAVSSTQAMAAAGGQSAAIKNGTKISAKLVSNVDARTARQGDKVVARVTRNVKQHGRIVVRKGDRLIGHVTSVQSAAKGQAGSSLGVRFDELVAGHSTTHLNTVLTSILSVPGAENEGPEPMEAPPMAAPVAVPSGRGGGGLLGGVGSTVGATAGAAGSTVGSVGGSLGAATQSTLGAGSALSLSTPAHQIHLGTEASANQSMGTNSVLRTEHGNLRLDSGTRMRFRVAAAGSAQLK